MRASAAPRTPARCRRVLVRAVAALAVVVAAAPATAATTGLIDPARGTVVIVGTTQPPRLGNTINDDVKRPRNYDQQPPIIPHRIDGYQVDKNFNKCLDCHARSKTEFSQAVPVSKTHYLDRSGKALEQISTRRYFCNQCHVAQDAVTPLVGNGFEGLEAMTVREAPTATPKPTPKR